MFPPDQSDTPSPLLDLEQLSIFLDVGMDEFNTIFADVVTDVPKTFAEIRDAFAAGRADIYRARLHSVRGMLSNFGCLALTRKLHALELANAFPPVTPDALHADLTSAWQTTHAAIRQWAAENS